MDAYFEPKVNLTFETYNFRQLTQAEDESTDKFVTRLREAASRCQFHDIVREIKDQVVQKCSSDRLRRKALREDLNLDNLLKAAQAMELADRQAKAMEDSAAVFKIGQRQRTRPAEQTTIQKWTGNQRYVLAVGGHGRSQKEGGPARLMEWIVTSVG